MAMIVGALILIVGAVVPVPVAAQTSDEAAKQAAREIQAARDQANAAAEALSQAESDLAVLQDGAQRLEDDNTALSHKVDKLRADVQSMAVARFATGGAQGIPLLTGLEAPEDQVQADVFVDVVTNTGSNVLDEYAAAQKQLRRQQADLEDKRSKIEDQKQVYAQMQDDAQAQVQHLREVEEERLNDEAVRRALAAQQAAALSKLEDAAIQRAEAAKRARPNPGDASTADTVPADSASIASANVDGADNAVTGPVVTVATNTGASGGTSGGRTGTGGVGSSPAGILTGSGYIDAIMCPLQGSAYGDSWGAPRSGGRHHEGVDMLAPYGTPIVAVVNGRVRYWHNRLGGNAMSLYGDNGNRYYYAHMSSYEGGDRLVKQGDVVGYVGSTGHSGANHLHFEVHPNGGLAVNPTPTVRAAGC